MKFTDQPRYTGPVQALIMDWAGTLIDFGSNAPVIGMQRLFAAEGVEISLAEARRNMGMHKRQHIAGILLHPEVSTRWTAVKGRAPTEVDADALYARYAPIQIKAIGETGVMIPGAVEALERLRGRGVKMGCNTGYSREMANAMLPLAAEQGFTPDSQVCVDEVARGRPAPDMALRNAVELGVDCVQACIKVDDAEVGMAEGLNAGMWTVGVSVSGTQVGMSLEAWQALDESARTAARAEACERLRRAGAHYVIDSIADIEAVVDDVEARMAAGERP